MEIKPVLILDYAEFRYDDNGDLIITEYGPDERVYIDREDVRRIAAYLVETCE